MTVLESPESSELSCMCFLPNCCLVATGHEDASIRLWNLDINQSIVLKAHQENQKHLNTISCIQGILWRDSEYLIAGSYDGRVSVWEISERRSTAAASKTLSSIFPQLKSFIDNTKSPTQPAKVSASHDFMLDTDEILCIQFDEARGNILIGGNNRHINVWSIRTQEHQGTYIGHEDSITCMCLDENFILSGSDDKSIIYWNLTGHEGNLERHEVGKLVGHTASVQALLMLTETGILLSCGYDRTVVAWRYNKNQAIWRIKKQEELRCMDYISTSKLLLVGTNGKSIMTIQIDHLLDPAINNMDFSENGENGELPDLQGLGLGDKQLNLSDIINNNNEVAGAYDENNMEQVEQLLRQMKQKEERDRLHSANNSEFLDKQELKDDDEMKLILQEQEKRLNEAREHGYPG